MDWRQEDAGANAGDVPQRVFERALLRRNLTSGVEVLQRAATAHAEVRAARRDAAGTRAQDGLGARELPGRFLLQRRDRRALARQCAFDEHRLAIDAGDAAAFLVERLDVGDARRGGGSVGHE